MESIDTEEAKTASTRLLDRALAGEDVIVSRGGKAVARLTRLEAPSPVRFGVMKGQFVVPEDFDAPLPDEVLAAFEGR